MSNLIHVLHICCRVSRATPTTVTRTRMTDHFPNIRPAHTSKQMDDKVMLVINPKRSKRSDIDSVLPDATEGATIISIHLKADPNHIEETDHSEHNGPPILLKKNMLLIGALIATLITLQVTELSLGLGLELRFNRGKGSGSNQPYQHAAVAADAAVCSQVGADILKKNGSAVDAAIASLFCVGVVNLHSTGIGGGGFMVYYNATSRKSTFIDYREVAPLKSTTNMFDNASSLRGK